MINSTGILYIDTPKQENKDAFSVDREIGEDEYVRMLREYSATIGSGIPTVSYNNRFDEYKSVENRFEYNMNYSKATTRLFNISATPCGIDEIYRIMRHGMGVLIIDINPNQMEDAFESEFKFWKKDSMNINNDTTINKDERIRFLPMKDLKFEIDNHVFIFTGCKIYCEYNSFKVALIIQEIKEI